MPEFPSYVAVARPVSAPDPLVCDLSGETVPVALRTTYRGQAYTLAPWVYEQLVRYGFGTD
jgi:hypothetical protein